MTERKPATKTTKKSARRTGPRSSASKGFKAEKRAAQPVQRPSVLRGRMQYEIEDLIYAAGRQVQIADFHLGELDRVLQTANPSRRPPVPVQAHFEGVVVSAMAAVDKVAQTVNSALNLGLSPSKLVQGAFDQLRVVVPDVGSWFDQPLGRDLRRIRTRMVHYSYSKGNEAPWIIESAGTDYDGSRFLNDYAGAAVKYLWELEKFLPEIAKACAPDAI